MLLKECLECYLCKDLKEHKSCGKVYTKEEALREIKKRFRKLL